MAALDRYKENLTNPRPPGTGCHSWIMSTANLGVMAGLELRRLYDDIRNVIPPGTRRISDREVQDAIRKALADHRGRDYIPRPRPSSILQNAQNALKKIVAQAKITSEMDLWEQSLIRLWEEPHKDQALLLSTLFDPVDLIWIGEHHHSGILGDTIRTVNEWITHFENGGKSGPHIIINPLNGIPAPTKTGDKTTLRGDKNIRSYRYCMAEFDGLAREDQIKFWSAVKLPIVALIDSGGKSIHSWLDVQKLVTVETPEQWQSAIKGRLYDRILKPLGIDGACSNPARLSRLPGHFREEKQAWQRLLWLSPEGRPVLC